MASLLDEYQLPADIPGYDLDPKELERMKYLGLMRLGIGMAGREPIGSAMSAGINTMIEGQTNARREMLARLQAYGERQKIEAIARQQAKEMAFIAKMTPEQRAKYGITEEVWSALQGSKDPAEKFFGSEFVKPYTLQPGQPRVIPGIGVTGAVANQQGQMPIFAPGGTTQLGTYNVPGYVGATEETAQATARGTGLGKAATEFEDVPVPGGRPGQTQKVLRSQLIGEQTANATQAAAQRTLQTLDAHIADEQGLLTKAIADNDPGRQRKHEENIKNLQAGKEKWQPYALTPTAPARISDPAAVTRATQGGQAVIEASKPIIETQRLQATASRVLAKQIDNLEALDKRGVFSGPAGWVSEQFTNAWNSAMPFKGLEISPERLANTQAFKSEVSKMQQALGKAFPGQQSNYELQVVTNELPTLMSTPEGRAKIYAAVRHAAEYEQKNWTSLTAHVEKNQGDALNWVPLPLPGPPELPQGVGTRETRGAIRGQPGGVTPNSTVRAFPKGPPVGTVINGKRFKGGDPNDPASWGK